MTSRSFAIATLTASLACAACAQDGIDYEIILDRPQTQTLRVRATIADVHEPEVELKLPAWRPGRYEILDHAGDMRWYRAESGAGEPLDIRKTDKATWVIDAAGAGTVVMEYEVYANALSRRTMHVDDTHAFLDGSAMLVYAPDRRDEPCRVRISAPDDWAVATGLDGATGDPRLFMAPDYDVLVDSPFEIGIHDVIEFDVDGVPHQIVIWGGPEYDADELHEDFADIVRAQAAMYGGLPYERYVFMIHARDGAGGATEHLNSTIIQTGFDTLSDDDRYKRFLGTVSHEFFHTWNVKHARPSGISPYDYSKENYTTQLWVAEGTTSYYDDLMLVRAGITKPDDYIKSLAGAFESHQRSPGRLVQSLEQSSFDAWIKFNVPSPDRVNTTVSFYSKGALVSFMLELAIRQASGGAASLDDVMADLFEASGWGGPGFTPEQFQAAAEARAGIDLDDFFDAYVRGTAELDIAPLLGAVGLEIEADADADDEADNEADDDSTDDDEEEEADKTNAYLGIDLRASGDFARVRAVREDGPAFDAGVEVDDTIIALDDRRMTDSNLDDLLEDVEPGQTIALTVMRNDVLRTMSITASEAAEIDIAFKRVDDPTDAQRAAYESWLGQPWPDDDETEIARVIDDWHAAAAEADIERYFDHFTPDAIFMGTDATEHWDRDAFLDYASPYFERGRAWTFHPRDRVIDVSGKAAWFDELLDSETYGELRGSGVLIKKGDTWKIAQYNLSIPLPNAIAADVVEQIARQKQGPAQDASPDAQGPR
jgi:predicted metalloprotease with PDZ domain/ketosteroid isomerase-like protein